MQWNQNQSLAFPRNMNREPTQQYQTSFVYPTYPNQEKNFPLYFSNQNVVPNSNRPRKRIFDPLDIPTPPTKSFLELSNFGETTTSQLNSSIPLQFVNFRGGVNQESLNLGSPVQPKNRISKQDKTISHQILQNQVNNFSQRPLQFNPHFSQENQKGFENLNRTQPQNLFEANTKFYDPDSSFISTTTNASTKRRRPIVVMNIFIGNGQQKEIQIFEGQDAMTVSKSFCQSQNLLPCLIEVLAEKISQQIDNYYRLKTEKGRKKRDSPMKQNHFQQQSPFSVMNPNYSPNSESEQRNNYPQPENLPINPALNQSPVRNQFSPGHFLEQDYQSPFQNNFYQNQTPFYNQNQQPQGYFQNQVQTPNQFQYRDQDQRNYKWSDEGGFSDYERKNNTIGNTRSKSANRVREGHSQQVNDKKRSVSPGHNFSPMEEMYSPPTKQKMDDLDEEIRHLQMRKNLLKQNASFAKSSAQKKKHTGYEQEASPRGSPFNPSSAKRTFELDQRHNSSNEYTTHQREVIARREEAQEEEKMKKKVLQGIFESLDCDGDGMISIDNVDISALHPEVLEDLSEVFVALEDGMSFTFQDFYNTINQKKLFETIQRISGMKIQPQRPEGKINSAVLDEYDDQKFGTIESLSFPKGSPSTTHETHDSHEYKSHGSPVKSILKNPSLRL